MRISYLQEFVTLAENLNFSQTAEECHISQPALSNHIAMLEKSMGVRLFERTRRSVALTKEGSLLVIDARKILELYRQMFRFDNKNLIDNQIITVAGFLENPVLMGFLATCIHEYSEAKGIPMKMMCDYLPPDQLIDNLTAGKLDFFVAFENTIDEQQTTEITSIPLIKDPFAVIWNANNPLGHKSAVSLADLRDLRFIHLGAPEFQTGWDHVLSACAKAGFEPAYRTVYVTTQECAFLEIGMDECFVFSMGGFANGLAFSGRTDIVCTPVVDASFPISLFFRKNDLPDLLADFIDFISKEYAEERKEL